MVSAATLTITATAGAASAVAGGVVSYTVTIANSGLSDYTGAAFTVPLAGVLGNAAYRNDAAAVITGTATSAGSVSYTSPDLGWAGTVPASGSVTLTYSVTVDNPDTGSQILASTVTSASTGSNCGGRVRRPAVHRHRDGLGADHRLHGEYRHRPPRAGWWATPPRWPTPGRPRTPGSA